MNGVYKNYYRYNLRNLGGGSGVGVKTPQITNAIHAAMKNKI